jgi:hypothetical protein
VGFGWGGVVGGGRMLLGVCLVFLDGRGVVFL